MLNNCDYGIGKNRKCNKLTKEKDNTMRFINNEFYEIKLQLNIVTGAVIILIIFLLIQFFIFVNNLGKEAYNTCIEKGHTERYCLDHI